MKIIYDDHNNTSQWIDARICSVAGLRCLRVKDAAILLGQVRIDAMRARYGRYFGPEDKDFVWRWHVENELSGVAS